MAEAASLARPAAEVVSAQADAQKEPERFLAPLAAQHCPSAPW